jgi:hypothetical protein
MAERGVSFEFLRAFGRFVKRWVGRERWPTLSTHEAVHGKDPIGFQGPYWNPD